MIDSLCPQKRKCRKNPANSPRVNQFRFIQKILTRKNESVLIHTAIRTRVAERRKNRSFTGFSCAELIKEQAQTAWLFSGEVRLNSFCQQKNAL